MNKDCFTPKVLEADCDNTPITFLTTEIEGVDDTVSPPQNSAYRNTIVKYLTTGHVYLYNSVGIPTLMNEGVVDNELSLDSVNPVQNKVITKALNEEAEARIAADNATNNALQAEQETRAAADAQLGKEIVEETQQREDADAGLEAIIDTKVDKVNGKGLSTNDYTNADKDIVDGLESKLDQDVLNSIQISSTTSTDVLVLEDGKVNLWTDSTNTHEVPLPVASPTSAGVLNSATFNAITTNSNNITNILQGTVAINNLPETPTQDELTEQWKTASGETNLINGARIRDTTNNVDWVYYGNINEWLSSASGGQSISVNTWTNNSAGIAKGSTEDGQIFAEADGTGSVNGWDTVKSNIANNASNITTLNTTVSNLSATVSTNTSNISNLNTEVSNNTSNISALQTSVAGKQDILVSGTNIKTVNGISLVGSGDVSIANDSIIILSPTMTSSDGIISKINFSASQIESISFDQWYGIVRLFPFVSDYTVGPNTVVNVGGDDDYPLYVRNPYDKSLASPIKSNITISYVATALFRFMKIAVGSDEITVCVLENVQDPASQNVYSTTEQVVGTWIDGRTIYRKVFEFDTAGTGAEKSIPLAINNIYEVVNISGGLKTSTDEFWPLQYVNPVSSTAQRFYVKSNYGKGDLVYYTGTNGKARIIFEYTKIE